MSVSPAIWKASPGIVSKVELKMALKNADANSGMMASKQDKSAKTVPPSSFSTSFEIYVREAEQNNS